MRKTLIFLMLVFFLAGCEQSVTDETPSDDELIDETVEIPDKQFFDKPTEEEPEDSTDAPSLGCSTDADCVPAGCCHATNCVTKDKAPSCIGVFCTMECAPNTLDCGGKCLCQDNKCQSVYVEI